MIVRAALFFVAIGILAIRSSAGTSTELANAAASMALLAVVLFLAYEIVCRVTTDRLWRRDFVAGISMGFVAGLIGGVPYALSAEPGFTLPYYVRAVATATLVGTALHLLIVTTLRQKKWIGKSARENEMLALVGAAMLTLASTLILVKTSILGHFVYTFSFHSIDWIGGGKCASINDRNDTCSFHDIRIVQVIFMIAVFAAAEVLHLSRRTLLSPSRVILALAALALISYVATVPPLIGGHVGHQDGTHSEPFFREPSTIGAFVLFVTAFVASIVRVLRWVRQRGVAEALTDAFPDISSLEAMLHARLGKTLPKTSDSSDTVFELVKLAEREGWGEALIVAARYAKPDHAHLAAIADVSGLGVTPPTDADILRLAQQLNLPVNAAPAVLLQRIIRQGGFQSPEDWRRRVAQLEGCVCRIEAPIGLALQLHFLGNSDSMSHHDSEGHGWWEHRSRRRWNCGCNRCGM